MTTHNFGEPTTAMKNQVGMIHHPNFTPEEKRNMRCTSNCNINCYFHSRMGCSIDVPLKVPQIRVGPQNNRGVYLPSTKHMKRSER
jgi:hypothetical protein